MTTSLNNIINTQLNFNEEVSMEIFGAQLGRHLFSKFLRLDRNLLLLCNSMDVNTKSKFKLYLSNLPTARPSSQKR